MRSLKLCASFCRLPPSRPRVAACTQTFHEVTESGTVNSKPAEPSASVLSCGCQNAVSANSLRSSTCGSTTTGAASFLFPSSLRSEEHTSELQSRGHLVCRLLLEKKKYLAYYAPSPTILLLSPHMLRPWHSIPLPSTRFS